MDVAHCRINLYYQGVDAANASDCSARQPHDESSSVGQTLMALIEIPQVCKQLSDTDPAHLNFPRAAHLVGCR